METISSRIEIVFLNFTYGTIMDFKIIVILVVHLFSKVNSSPLTELIKQDLFCKNVNITDWIFLPYSRCVQILFEANAFDEMCHSEIFHYLIDTAVYIKSLSYVKHRNIAKQYKSNCESFLILSPNQQAIYNLFNSTPTASPARIFFPFSRLYFMVPPSDTNLSTLQAYLYSNALFGYNLIRDRRNDEIISIYDLLSETHQQSPPNATDLSHPFINITDPSKEFTISSFNCTPSVKYLERIGNDYR